MIIEATHLYLEGDQSKFKRNFHFRIVRRVFCFLSLLYFLFASACVTKGGEGRAEEKRFKSIM